MIGPMSPTHWIAKALWVALCCSVLSVTPASSMGAGPLDRSPEELLAEIRSKGNSTPKSVFEELASQGTPEALEALLKGLDAVSKIDKRCEALASLKHFKDRGAAEAEAVDYLASCALRREEQFALHAVYRLGEFWPACREELLDLVFEHETEDGRSVALMHLVENGMALDDKELKRLLRSKDEGVRYEALLASRGRLADSAKRGKETDKLLKSRDGIERMVGAELLALAEPQVWEAGLTLLLVDKEPRVRRKALAVLEGLRHHQALELLIARLPDASRGERHRIAAALERMTGKSLGTQAASWQRWWKAEGANFQFPDADSTTEPENPTPAGGELTSSSFYGLPIYAENLVFAIDASDSMKKSAKKDSGPSRMEVAKRQLVQAIEGLQSEARFDIVHFGKRAWSWKGELVVAKDKHKAAASKHVQYMDLSWGTEIYRALREAYRDPEADTILFLTDGDPQLSLMQDRKALQRIVAQWNRTRHTSIDCITIGTDRAWLKSLSELTGGRYRRID